MSETAPRNEALEDKTAGSTKPSPAPARPSSPRSPVFSILGFLLLAGGLAALAWRQETGMVEQEARLQEQATLAADVQRQLAEFQRETGSDTELESIRQAQDESAGRLEQSLQVLRDELSAANARVASQAAQLDTLNRELAATNERLRSSEVDVERDWMLAEARSLLRLAGERLALARDVDAAIALYRAAAQLLEAMAEPGLASAREALTRELQTLQSLPRVAAAQLYEQLAAQAERLDTFAIAADANAVDDFTVPTVPADATQTGGWFSTALDTLQQYFVVTKRDEAVTPLLSAEEEYLVRRGIRQKIAAAQLALLQGEPELYRAALADAIRAIEMELQEADEKNSFVAELNVLRDTPIVVEIPPLGAALDLLNQSAGTPL